MGNCLIGGALKFNTRKITLVAVLYMGYFTSRFLKLVFPFIDMPISVLWNAIIMEYLGYSVFLYYVLYCIPFIIYGYTGVELFKEGLVSMVNELPLNINFPNHPLIVPIVYLIQIGQNFFFSWLIHRTLKKSRCFPSFIY